MTESLQHKATGSPDTCRMVGDIARNIADTVQVEPVAMTSLFIAHVLAEELAESLNRIKALENRFA